MESYEKKYKDALERARDYYKTNLKLDKEDENLILEDIFPELKETEDDLTWLTKYIEEEAYSLSLDIRDDEDRIRLKKLQKAVAWLKKQGEQKSTLPKWKYKKDDAPLSRDSLILNRYGCVVKAVSGAMVSDAWVLDYDELAKLPKEEKVDSANKPVLNFKAKDWYVSKVDGKIHSIYNFDEPKFKVGDWAVNNNSGGVCQVTEIRNDGYCLWPLDGEIMGYLRIINVDDDYHLWTIADAKDGDILATSFGAFIYNGNNGGGSCPGCYCGIDTLGNFKAGTEHHWTTKPVFPATKEQNDTLFAKMREAGYEWDADKKELKEIELHNSYKLEPNFDFSVGQWIVVPIAKKVFLITKIEGFGITLVDIDGDEYVFGVDSLKNARLWTVADAKEGDVLSNGKMIVIFKHFEEPSYKQHIVAYIGLDAIGAIQITDDTWYLGIGKTHPATKEQRELLFQKMREAKYEWNAEKKELKKIPTKMA